ncbi:hypothetical protein [Arthrobacter caoxuetaonis]|uniref:Uncharacterized protein n=1 Tax=Arthrobacter caoxuetaonis TaxID=2886935 RepID=A0A9X1MFW1_9MICC|nr:hypothetical protein [Arthrobacter caoxuetaonis]MCC3299334.1 hypothetical protein [Arthrobacter caoxuetaonis]USQ59173.1 hypothetical protein NF551_18880 [Arthrobacter caoxuetaonis]
MVAALQAETTGFAPESWLIPSARTDEDDELSMFNRTDPYWDRLWAPGSQAVWTSRHTGPNDEPVVSFGARENKRLLMSRDEAMDILTSNRGRAERLAAWGVLDSWRTVSSEQLAVLTGSTFFLDPNYSQITASFAAEVLDIGSFALRNGTLPGRGQTALYRPRVGDAFEKELKKTLTWPEWVSVTGGYEWSSGGQFDRHNLLATELAIRAAEYLPGIGTVMGEKFSSIGLLAGLSADEKENMKARLERARKRGPEALAAEMEAQRPSRVDNRRGDGTIVRGDGLRIVYELTATSSVSFESKVRRWAETIAERPLETSGMTVVFIAAPHPDRDRHTSADPIHKIYKTIAKVLREFPGTGTDSPAARIGVAHWQEWFPARGQISDAFLDLQADFALGTGADRWVPRRLMSTAEYRFTPFLERLDPMALIENSRLLTATPHWLRTGDHTHLVGTPLDRSKKQPADIPHPYPARPNRTSGRMLGESVGAVTHPTRLPERLRIEGRDIAAQKAYQERKKARAAARRNAAARPAWE